MRKGILTAVALMLLIISSLVSSVEGTNENTDPYLNFIGEDMYKPMEVKFNRTFCFNITLEDLDRDTIELDMEIYTVSLVNRGEVDELIFVGPLDEKNWSVHNLTYRVYIDGSFTLDHGIPRGAGLHSNKYAPIQYPDSTYYYYETERYSQLSGKIDDPSIFVDENGNLTARSLLFIIRASDGDGGSNFISKVVDIRRDVVPDPPSIHEIIEEDSGVYIGPDPNAATEEPPELTSPQPTNDGSDEVDFPWGIALILLGTSIFLITLGVSMYGEDRKKK